MKTHSKYIKNFVVLVSLFFAGLFFVDNVYAQIVPKASLKYATNVVFPIKELGNCKDRSSCRAYCDIKENIVACAGYAADHNMISREQANKAKEFADAINGGGPLGCDSASACQKVCADTKNIDSCLSFAEKHSLISNKELTKAKKAQKVLKSGGKLPGTCNDMASCEAYCAVSSNIEECLTFAKSSGLMSEEEIAQAEKVMPYIKEGKTPGKCASKASCEAYCENGDHFDECISFAENVGFVSKEEATMARKAGGKGPGGCKSQVSCEAYCNDPINTKECFQFAKDKGILPPEKIKEIEVGMSQLKEGLDKMPKEMKECITNSLGEDTFSQIKAGTLTPGPAIGNKIKSCVEEFKPKLTGMMNKAFDVASPESLKCLSDKIGEKRFSEIKGGDVPTAVEGDVIKKCFEAQRSEGLKKAREGLNKMPKEMRACVESKLGSDVISKIEAGDENALGPESVAVFQSCVAAGMADVKKKVSEGISKIPDFAKDCVKGKLGNNFEEDLASGKISPEKIQGVITACMKDVVGTKYRGEGGYPGSGGQGSIPNIPKDMNIPPQGSGMEGAPPKDMVPSNDQMCTGFAMAPSCDYVPENVRDVCRKCKGQ